MRLLDIPILVWGLQIYCGSKSKLQDIHYVLPFFNDDIAYLELSHAEDWFERFTLIPASERYTMANDIDMDAHTRTYYIYTHIHAHMIYVHVYVYVFVYVYAYVYICVHMKYHISTCHTMHAHECAYVYIYKYIF